MIRPHGRDANPPMTGMVKRVIMEPERPEQSHEERFIELVCRRADERKDAITAAYDPSAWSRK